MKIFKCTLMFNVVCMAMLSACSSMDKSPSPSVSYTPTWQYENLSPAAIAVEREWWNSFQSPQLAKLIETAQLKNPDAVIAAEHVKQAELQMKIANASLFPEFGLNASSGERKTKAPGADWINNDSTSVGVSASYEVDLWGGSAANRRAASSIYKSTVFSTEATRLSISAGVATAWFNYLALQERIETAQKNIVIAERIQKVVDSLYRNGAATAADVAQQKTNLLSQQAAILPLQLQLNQTRAAIALLEGQVPQGYQLAQEKFSAVAIPDITAGVPADVVTHRPDVASAEAQLQAASANVYEARTALLPNVQLTGNLGKTTTELFSLSPATQVAGWSLSLAQTLFAGGRLVNQLHLTESRRAELLEDYRKIILTSLQEVDDALNRVNVTQHQEQNQQEIVVQAERSLHLIEARYREGGNDLISLLDAQRSLFQAQDQLVQQRLSRIKASVDLYKALGGGWKNN